MKAGTYNDFPEARGQEQGTTCDGGSSFARTYRPHILGLIKREQERVKSAVDPSRSQRPHKRKRTGSRSTSPIELLEEGSSAGPSTPRPSKYFGSSQTAELHNIPSSDVEEDETAQLKGEWGLVCMANPSAHFTAANCRVSCPICQAQVTMNDMNAHIDRGCKDPVNPKASASSAWSKLMANPSAKQKGKQKSVCVPVGKLFHFSSIFFRKTSDPDEEEDRIPKASYATLKEKSIREMLKDYGLSTIGNRAQLEARHQQ